MKRFIYCLALAALAAVTSCKTVDLPIQVLKPNTDRLVAPSFGAEYEIAVESNTAWKLCPIGEDWISSEFEQTVGKASFTVSVSVNGGASRSASIVLQSIDGALSKNISVSQLPGEGGDYLPLSAVRALEKKGGEYIFPTGRALGFVSVNTEMGNYPENTMFIQDNFSERKSGIAVCCKDMPRFESGIQLDVDLSGAKLKRSEEGVLTLYPASVPIVGECTALDIPALSLGYDELAGGDYESMLVKIVKFQVKSEYIGQTFGVCPLLENRDGQTVLMQVKPDAIFAEASYNKGSGTVCGIAGAFSDGKPSIRPRDKADVTFGHFRIGELPGIKSLPYAFSFYCASKTDGDVKYINYTPLTWQPATKMISGTVAEDKDINVGAYLEMAAYGSEIGKIYGGKGTTNCWAEPGANDNINTSGFVSPDGKTTPTAECGWWLTVPLQTDLPSKFNVIFGLCGAEWSINTWILSYSNDKKDWIEAGTVKLDRPTSGGSYYYRFCVTVTPAVPLEADGTLYLKITPSGTQGCNPANIADGHGSSCNVRLHSAIIIQDATEQSTPKPEGAVLFEPFDNLTGGADWFYGERNAAMANYCGAEFSSWTSAKKRNMSGSQVYERPGYAQIGFVNDETTGSRQKYTSSTGSLTTAPLGKGGDFTLSFKAGAYRTPAIRPECVSSTPDVGSPDITTAVLKISGGGTINGATNVSISSLPTDYSWKTYTFSIKGATAATTLTFTSAPSEGQFSRWFIDEILVK